uniref:Uncharacterized protein n=1 Tax=Amorphochlora amoebiformis TaxID=1561963 RepID=A0A7S0GZN6_9EUKA|mmetsp:Transcript_21390/g.33767  ORF Transcript_21390/g.33767 Transcript_21390/m.33767 type:complete len:112 (+) Transcript_21390:1-336(+)
MKNLQSRQQAVEIGGCGVDPGKKKQGWGTWFSLLRWEGQKDPIYEALLRYEKLHRPPRVITFGEINLKEIGAITTFEEGHWGSTPSRGEKLIYYIPNSESLTKLLAGEIGF